MPAHRPGSTAAPTRAGAAVRLRSVLEQRFQLVTALPDDARVVDVGGWAAPLNRADWVLDAMPYETRGGLEPAGVGPGPERFNLETWVERDLLRP